MMKLIESKANKSGEPNIVWRENSQFYLVKIRRRGKTFTANARTIEDAIKKFEIELFDTSTTITSFQLVIRSERTTKLVKQLTRSNTTVRTVEKLTYSKSLQ